MTDVSRQEFASWLGFYYSEDMSSNDSLVHRDATPGDGDSDLRKADIDAAHIAFCSVLDSARHKDVDIQVRETLEAASEVLTQVADLLRDMPTEDRINNVLREVGALKSARG